MMKFQIKVGQFFNKFKEQEFSKKEIILYADNNNQNVFYIKSGYVRAYRISEQGEELTLTILKAEDIFPLSLGLIDSNNPYYLEAITPVQVRSAKRDDFLEFIKSEPDVFYDMTSLVFNHYGSLLNRMEYLIISRAYTKVATTLLSYAKRFGEQKGNDLIVNLPLTHKDIATLVGITRETTCLEMKKLEKMGLIAHQGRLLVIKDVKRLEEESYVNSDSELAYANLF